MTTQTIESELLGLEKRYWQALQDQDAEAAVELSDDPCLLAGAQGLALIDRKTLATMMKSPNYTLDRYELKEDAQVRLLADDVAAVAYTVHEDLTVDGKPVSLDAADTSIWVRRDGRWLCAVHTESLSGDSFGRDRRTGE